MFPSLLNSIGFWRKKSRTPFLSLSRVSPLHKCDLKSLRLLPLLSSCFQKKKRFDNRDLKPFSNAKGNIEMEIVSFSLRM